MVRPVGEAAVRTHCKGYNVPMNGDGGRINRELHLNRGTENHAFSTEMWPLR